MKANQEQRQHLHLDCEVTAMRTRLLGLAESNFIETGYNCYTTIATTIDIYCGVIWFPSGLMGCDWRIPEGPTL